MSRAFSPPSPALSLSLSLSSRFLFSPYAFGEEHGIPLLRQSDSNFPTRRGTSTPRDIMFVIFVLEAVSEAVL